MTGAHSILPPHRLNGSFDAAGTLQENPDDPISIRRTRVL
jgi:hypothetical protein